MKRGEHLSNEVEAKKKKIQILRERQENIASVLNADKVQTNASNRNLAIELIADIVDLEKEYLEDIGRLNRVEREIKIAISNVPTDKSRVLLSLKYESMLTWEVVCVEMGYSWQHIHRLHSTALDEVRKNT